MVISRENVINGGYKSANTRPISASFSPFPSPSRLMNLSPRPTTLASHRKMQNLSSWTVHLRFRHRNWTLGRDLERLLNEQPDPSKCANVPLPPRGAWANFLTVEKSPGEKLDCFGTHRRISARMVKGINQRFVKSWARKGYKGWDSLDFWFFF